MSAAACPNCNIILPSEDIAGGWCENCGKRIPPYVLKGLGARSVSPPTANTFQADAHPAPALAPKRHSRLKSIVASAAGLICLAYTGVLSVFLAFGWSQVRSGTDVALLIGLGVLASGLLYAGVRLINAGRKMRVRSADQVLAEDGRPPVLYLRSFGHDRTAAQVVSTDVPVAEGGLIGNLLLLGIRTEEEQIAEVFNEIGPFVAIGRPGDRLPELGAARMYVKDDDWQTTVGNLMEKSRLVVFRAADSDGFWWEVERAAADVSPEKLLFLIPTNVEYSQFRDRAVRLIGTRGSRMSGLKFPTDQGKRLKRCGTISSVLYFRPDGTGQFLPPKSIFGRGKVKKPIVPMLKQMLQPVFEQVGVPWSPAPVRWGLYALVDGLFLTLIAVLVLAIVFGKRPPPAASSAPASSNGEREAIAAATNRLAGQWTVDRESWARRMLIARGVDPSLITAEFMDNFKNLTPTIEFDFQPNGKLLRRETLDGRTESLEGEWEVTKVVDNVLTLRVTLGQHAGTMTLKFTDDDTIVESSGAKAELKWKRKKG